MFGKAGKRHKEISQLLAQLVIGQSYTNTLLKTIADRQEALVATLDQALADLTAAVNGAVGELQAQTAALTAAIAANDPAKAQAAADAIEAQAAALTAATQAA